MQQPTGAARNFPKFQWLLLPFKSCRETGVPHGVAGIKPALYPHIKALLQHCTICNHRTALNRLGNTCTAACTLPRLTLAQCPYPPLSLFEETPSLLRRKLLLLPAPFNQQDNAQFLTAPREGSHIGHLWAAKLQEEGTSDHLHT